MEFLFVITYLLFVFLNSRIAKHWVTGFILVFAPYSFFILLNNYVFVNFFRISNGSIAILFFGMLIYEITFIFYYLSRINQSVLFFYKYATLPTCKIDDSFNYRLVEKIVLIIVFFRLISVLIIYLKGGLGAITANNYQSLNLGPIGARLIIFLYPLGWMLFYSAFNKNSSARKIYQGILVLLVLCVEYLSYIKAHAIIYVVGLYIIASIRNPRNAIRGGVVVLTLAILLFFGNYALRWYSADYSTPSFEYTINHFWKYVAGSTINLNGTAFSNTTNYNFFDYWLQVLAPIPNEFLSVLDMRINSFSLDFFPYLAKMAPVSKIYYEYSNVVNIFGFFYGSGGWNIIGFVINVIVYACFTESSAFRVIHPKSIPSLIFGVSCLAYSFLSFFCLYFGTSAFWQICFYSYIIPMLLHAEKNNKRMYERI